MTILSFIHFESLSCLLDNEESPADIVPTVQEQATLLRNATEQVTNALLEASKYQAALDQRVRELEEALGSASQEVKNLKEENAELKDNLREAETDIKLLSQDQELLRKELELEISSNKRLQTELNEFEHRAEDFQRLDEIINSFSKQKEQCADLQKQLQTFENRAEDFKHLDETVNDLNEQKKQYAELQEQLEASKVTEQQLEHSKATIEKLKGRIRGLEDERDLKGPLLQTAVDVRRRFMIQAREKLYPGTLAEATDAGNIKIGDMAAHNGDGLADEALLLAGFLTGERWTAIFGMLYGKKPGEFAEYPCGLRRLKDCEVTIRTLQPVRGARPCFQARSEAEALILAITQEYEKDNDRAERRSLVQNSITRVVQLTEEIVESARGSLIFPMPVEES